MEKDYRLPAECVLLDLSLSPNYRAFDYIVDCIVLLIDDPARAHYVCYDLYPVVARVNQTTPAAVERAVRLAVERIYLNAQPEYIDKYLRGIASASVGRATVGAFLSTLAWYIKRHDVV